MMAAYTAAAMAVIAAGTAVYGAVSEGQARGDAAEAEAYLKKIQADEVDRRAVDREKVMRNENAKTLHGIESMYAASGFELEGSPLLVLESQQGQMETEIQEMIKDSHFRSMMLRSGANIEMEQSGGYRTSGALNGFGSAFSKGAQAYSLLPKNSAATETTGNPGTYGGATMVNE
jgi:hypothetical protein